MVEVKEEAEMHGDEQCRASLKGKMTVVEKAMYLEFALVKDNRWRVRRKNMVKVLVVERKREERVEEKQPKGKAVAREKETRAGETAEETQVVKLES